MRLFRHFVAGLAPALLCACMSAPSPHPNGTTLNAGGVQTYVRDWGAPAPDAPDVLLIHGALSHSGVFVPDLVPALQDRFRVVAYDRPGMGRTADRPKGSDTLAAQAAVAAGVIEATGQDRPVVVAHSFGGAVALRLALDRPDLVSGLVLLSPASHPWDGGVDWNYHLSANPVSAPAFNRLVVPLAGRAMMASGLESGFAPEPVPENYREEAELDLILLPRAQRANAEDMVALNGELRAQAPLYPGIDMPVLILVGDSDRSVSADIHSRALARDVPGAQLIWIPGAGHMTQVTAADRVPDAIDAVLEAAR